MTSTNDIHSVGPYIIGNTLGAGVTGKVKLAFHKNTGEQVAIKIINKELIAQKPAMEPKLRREIAVMKLLNHPHVLHMYDVIDTPEFFFLVLEYAPGGELFDFLVKKGALDTLKALNIFQQIVSGLEYCHQHYICHRDLKPENLLLDSENNIKIADFGMSALKVQPESLFDTSCGSPHYASPEVVQGISYDGQKADIWSCGVILFALVTGKLPFDDENIRKLLTKVKSGVFTMPPYLHRDIQDLISKMLTVNPEERISIEEIKKHPWFNSFPIPQVPPTPLLEPCGTLVPNESIDEGIIHSIEALGFGNRQFIIDRLTHDGDNMIKAFYQLYEERSIEPKLQDKYAKKLARARSENMRKVTKQPSNPSIKPASKGLFEKTKRLTRRLSYNANSAVKLERPGVVPTDDSEEENNFFSLDAANTHSEPDKPKHEGRELKKTPSIQLQRIKLEPRNDLSSPKEASTPRRVFLAWFGSVDPPLKKVKKKNLGEGIESKKSIGELTHELEETLEAIGATYSFSNKRDRIKARITKESRSIKFSIILSLIVDDEEKKDKKEKDANVYWVSFKRRSGDRVIYTEICNNIKSLLNV